MKAVRTFSIGITVTLLGIVQFCLTLAPGRLVTVAVGLALAFFGWKIGWTGNRRLTTLLGHLAVTAGCLVTAHALYQIPFLPGPPSLVEVLDLPLFWGLFTIAGGWCMITHGHCACAIRMHDAANARHTPPHEGDGS